MPEIKLLTQETIDKIAAGEIIERPSSVVKELVENAIDAKATAITVEIKDGGTSLIRITDNGCGIPTEQIEVAFLRHSTSKIENADDLMTVKSLGFRGEALSSISAVAQVELITKTQSELLGCRYIIEGSREVSKEDIGAPNGTTFLIKNLFFNTPARKKFLKSNTTEGTYVNTLMEHLAMSHPEIAFKFISNGQTKLSTSGNTKSKDIIYQIFGRDITTSLLEVNHENDFFKAYGFIGKPVVSRGNRGFENYYINNRYSKSNIITKGIEDGYKNFLMQHQYPFCVLYFDFKDNFVDVNVHPTKMEVRFSDQENIYYAIKDMIHDTLAGKEHIVDVNLLDEDKKKEEVIDRFITKERNPEPFEIKRLEQIREEIRKNSPYEKKYSDNRPSVDKRPVTVQDVIPVQKNPEPQYVQQNFLSEIARKSHRIIGQIFNTYWLVEFENKLFIIDQHAAHEKVLYEKNIKKFNEKTYTSQYLSPPLIITLNADEIHRLEENKTELERLGFNIECFGGLEYAISAIPDNLYNLDIKQILIDFLDDADATGAIRTPEIINDKLATMSCKAAIKGGMNISRAEAEHLIDELLALENPYFCPHGRPTIISMTEYELEKKFKRII